MKYCMNKLQLISYRFCSVVSPSCLWLSGSRWLRDVLSFLPCSNQKLDSGHSSVASLNRMDLSPWLLTASSGLDQAGAQQASECFSSSLTDAYEAQCLTSLITVPAVVTAATCLPGPSPDLREVNKTVSFRLATCPESRVSFSPYVWPAIVVRRSQRLSFRCIPDRLQDTDKTPSPIC